MDMTVLCTLNKRQRDYLVEILLPRYPTMTAQQVLEVIVSSGQDVGSARAWIRFGGVEPDKEILNDVRQVSG